MGPAVG